MRFVPQHILSGWQGRAKGASQYNKYKSDVTMKTPKIFISYSHKDRKYKEELLTRLKVISRHSAVDEWHDENMLAGDEIDQTILKNLNESNIVCLLISPNFIASEYCFETEMKAALSNVKNHGK